MILCKTSISAICKTVGKMTNRQDVLDVQLLVRQGCVEVNELDRLCQDVLTKIGSPPSHRLFPNLSSQQFSQHYQSVRRVL
jgi:hypothetical protein